MRGLAESPENPRAWLFAVAGNLATDEVRRVLRRKKHLALIEARDADRVEHPDPEGEMERRERLARARAALESLSERDREVLLLWDGGLAYGEIAGRMGLAPGAIGTTLARARKRLAEAYRQGDSGAPSQQQQETGGHDVAHG